MDRKLRRITERKRRWFGGVYAGLAYWIGMPIWLMRLLWTASILLLGTSWILYMLLWIFMPEWKETPKDYEQVTES